MIDPEAILTFWFGTEPFTATTLVELRKRWFQGGPEIDQHISDSFCDLPRQAISGVLDPWRDEPRSALALIIVLDQFPRNQYRNTPEAFLYDDHAGAVLKNCLDNNLQVPLHPVEQVFLYLPYEHAEDIGLQELSVSLFTALLRQVPMELKECFQGFLDYALAHRDVIRRFGRFPHRNKILKRTATQEESDYLATVGRGF